MKKLILTLLLSVSATLLFAQEGFIAPQLTGTDLIVHLQQNYSVTSPQSYNSARDAMFEDIDGPNGVIVCVYTGHSKQFSDRSDAQGNQSAGDFNTEHSWPQSFYDSASPMRTDIHHLYPTRVDVNGARSNYDFDEIPDSDTDRWYRNNSNTTSIPSSNIDEYSELDTDGSRDRFEPREDHKGNVARAMFYFWAIYQNNTAVTSDNTDNEAFFNRMKDVLLSWHDADPVDQTEIDRSVAIENVQGNRNPFVHDTTLVRRAFFGGLPVSNENESLDNFYGFKLYQNYPNPFNPSTIISFDLTKPANVEISFYNSVGVQIKSYSSELYASGNHTLRFDANELPAGIYFYSITVNGKTEIQKMSLIK